MATVNKNFRIKQGLIVEGATGTINGQDILTKTGGDSYILNLVGGATLVTSVESTQMEVISGELNIKSGVFDAYGAAAAAQSAAITAAASDATTKASAAQAAATTAAATDATTKVAAEAALRVSGDAASVSTAASDATTKANAAQSAAATDATTKANAAQAAAEATAAAALSSHESDTTNVHGIANTALLATTANVATAKSEAIADAATDATAKANAAQSAAEATAAAANTAQQNGTTSFTAINYNSVAKQVAATTGNIVTAAATTAISWVAADYRSAKFVVKAKNGVHTQVSDLVVTLDTANNVAVSEYGITYSNGTELAAVTADYSGSDVRIRVTPANNNTEVIVVGTLIK